MASPKKLRDVPNVNFGVLNETKNKFLVRYNASAGEYILSSMDTILSSSQVLDGDLPDDFVDQIEEEIDATNLDFDGVDGGAF